METTHRASECAPGGEPASLTVAGPPAPARCRLDETPLGRAGSRLELRPYEIASL